MKELDKAIEDLKREYEKAKKISYVNNPLAYAIYRVWEKYDKQTYNKRGEE